MTRAKRAQGAVDDEEIAPLILLNSPIKEHLPKTRFTRFLVRLNQPHTTGFEEWVFSAGMTFGAPDTWWGEKGPRAGPHEGLDLCFYRKREGRIVRLLPETKIPVMYDGTLVAILNDFLGKTVIVEHGIRDEEGRVLFTMYAHLAPAETMQPGRTIKQGDIIAGLAPAPSKADILPHVHLSVGWAVGAIAYDTLDWRTLGEEEKLTLVDPLPVLDCAS